MKILCLISILLLFPALSINALTMEEAVKLALDNNPRIKEKQHVYDAQGHRVKSEKADFLPDLDLNYSYTSQDNVQSYQTRNSSIASVEMSLNLFNGFIDTNELKEAGSLLDAYFYQKKSVEADVIFEVKSACIEVFRAGKNLEVAREAVELLERQKKEAELFYREGLFAKNDVLKVEVELASARQKLLRAESALKTAGDELERAMSFHMGDEKLEETPIVENTEPDYNKLYTLMMNSRSELKYLEAFKEAKRFAAAGTKGEYLPTVDISLTYNQLGDSASPTGREGRYDNETKAMLTAEWELGDRLKKRHDVRAEELDIRIVEAQIGNLKDELALQLKSAMEDYRLANGRMELADRATGQAKENYRITNSQLRQQMATTTDMLLSRVALSRARNDYNSALYDIQLAVVTIERVVESFSP